jgi:FkbM family methyltransferase
MAIITEQNYFDDLKNILGREELSKVAKRGVIHVGADVGQEVEQYFSYGFEKIVLIEANPEPFKILSAKFGGDPRIKMFNNAICERNGQVDFHVHTSRSGNTEPGSLLAMKRFSEIVKTLHTARTIQVSAVTLDALFETNRLERSDYNFINLDIQGAELFALQGATATLPSIDVVISEVSLIELYEGGSLEDDIVAFLGRHGFDKTHVVYHTLYDETSTFPAWGECLFIKR